ncbi:DMT family transporter [Vibrio sp.]|nr:DMT family transporter [Vibrio sp.]
MIYMLPFFTVLIWGGNTIVNKMASFVIEPGAMSFYRWVVAVIILTPFCLPNVLRQWHAVKQHLFQIIVLSALGLVINQSLGYYAGQTTSASNMSLISSLVPLFSVFASVPLLKKRISLKSVIGAGISLVGLTYMLGQGDLLFFLRQKIVQGDVLMLAASFVYAFYCVLLKKWEMPFGNWTLIYLQGISAVIMLIPLWMSSDHLLPTVESAPLIAYAGIAASVIAPWLWVKAINALGADSAAMFMNLLPVIAVTFAAIILGETIHLFHVVGGLMVVFGVLLSQVKIKLHRASPKFPPISHA